MVLPVHMAMGPKEPPVVRGIIQTAVYQVWEDGKVLYVDELDVSQAPYQKNNMSAWLQLIMSQKHTPHMVKDFRGHWRTIQYIVNDGQGRLKGRTSRNVFTFIFKGVSEWKIDLVIMAKLHQQVYNEKVKSGAHIPTPKVAPTIPTEPYVSLKDGHIHRPDDLGIPGLAPENWGWQVYQDHEKFYTDYPHLRNKLPSLDL